MSVVRIADVLAEKVAVGSKITVRGWVRTRRDSKAGLSFVNVSDGSCLHPLQVVAPGAPPNAPPVATGFAPKAPPVFAPNAPTAAPVVSQPAPKPPPIPAPKAPPVFAPNALEAPNAGANAGTDATPCD